MATVGPNSPTAAVSITAASRPAWSNPTNAEALDGVFATVIVNNTAGNTNSELLALSSYGLSSIPDAAVINGFTVVASVKKSASTAVSFQVQIAQSGVVKGSAKGVTLTTTLAATTLGSSVDLWGTTGLTGADVKDPGFQVTLEANASTTPAVTVSVDYASLTVTYTASTPVTFAPEADGVSTATIALISPHLFTATANGASTATAAVSTKAFLIPTANGASTASIGLSSPARLTPTANGVSSMTAAITVPVTFAPTVNGASSATASVIAAALLTATANGASSATVALRTPHLFVVTANGASISTIGLRSPALLTVQANGASAATMVLGSPHILHDPLTASVSNLRTYAATSRLDTSALAGDLRTRADTSDLATTANTSDLRTRAETN